MFWQQNNLTSFKESDNYLTTWVSGGLGQPIHCSLSALQMLDVAIAKSFSSVPLSGLPCLHADFLHGSRYCSGEVKLFGSFLVTQSAFPVQCLLISFSHRTLALLSHHALDHCLLCPCGYLRGLTYLSCHLGTQGFASERLLHNYLFYKITELKTIQSCTFTPSLHLSVHKALSPWMLTYITAKLSHCSGTYGLKSSPVLWSLHLDKVITA